MRADTSMGRSSCFLCYVKSAPSSKTTVEISLLHCSWDNSIFARGLFPIYHQSTHNVTAAWLYKLAEFEVTTVTTALVSWSSFYNQEEKKSLQWSCHFKTSLERKFFQPLNSTKTSQQTTSFEPLSKPWKDNQTFLSHFPLVIAAFIGRVD